MVPTVSTANAYSILADDPPEPDPNLLEMEEMEDQFPALLECLDAHCDHVNAYKA